MPKAVNSNGYLHLSYPLTDAESCRKQFQPILSAPSQLLECAFPQSIEDNEYFPLISISYDQMSDRCLAQVIAELTGEEYPAVLNDVYGIGAAEAFSSATKEIFDKVKQKLIRCYYKKWLLES